jgi:nicotinate-nucleotide--dimethylbenzimidazole phosphoribosyltransferase
MTDLRALHEKIRPLNGAWIERAKEHLKIQTRPEGSLGYLEEVISRLVAIQETLEPSVERKILFVLASDHGVAEEGVSLYPQEVTSQMVANFARGGATINAFARHSDVDLKVIDVGVRHPISDLKGVLQRKIAPGTRNMTQGPAMTESELIESLELGIELVKEAKEQGYQILGTGEMGIANTTSASAIVAAITGEPAQKVTGYGTGISPEMWQRKVDVIRKALEVNREFLGSPLGILQALGGFEIAGITGMVIGCALEGMACMVDGLIASAGAAVAIEWNPHTADYLFFGHKSQESGHGVLLKRYLARPILDLDLRLGEGTGACLAMIILEAMVRAFNEVATFEEASVSKRER